MTFQIEQALEILERTPATLQALLSGLSTGWTQTSGDIETWDAYAVIGHLIHCEETDWLPRAEIILQNGETRPFEPFDRLAQFDRFTDQPLDQLLDMFAGLRRQNLARLKAMQLTPAQLALRGTHPELGPVTLGQLLAAWVVHDLNHIGQIVEALSKRYGQDVGPWQAYMPILGR
jgi:uncharacterized damage-inducible protein DinB